MLPRKFDLAQLEFNPDTGIYTNDELHRTEDSVNPPDRFEWNCGLFCLATLGLIGCVARGDWISLTLLGTMILAAVKLVPKHDPITEIRTWRERTTLDPARCIATEELIEPSWGSESAFKRSFSIGGRIPARIQLKTYSRTKDYNDDGQTEAYLEILRDEPESRERRDLVFYLYLDTKYFTRNRRPAERLLVDKYQEQAETLGAAWGLEVLEPECLDECPSPRRFGNTFPNGYPRLTWPPPQGSELRRTKFARICETLAILIVVKVLFFPTLFTPMHQMAEPVVEVSHAEANLRSAEEAYKANFYPKALAQAELALKDIRERDSKLRARHLAVLCSLQVRDIERADTHIQILVREAPDVEEYAELHTEITELKKLRSKSERRNKGTKKTDSGPQGHGVDGALDPEMRERLRKLHEGDKRRR